MSLCMFPASATIAVLFAAGWLSVALPAAAKMSMCAVCCFVSLFVLQRTDMVEYFGVQLGGLAFTLQVGAGFALHVTDLRNS